MINVYNLQRTFKVPIREKGLNAAFKGLFNKKYKIIDAVKNINFSIDSGEIVAFLGPNGAGKTTTLKMLAGLIYPSSGEINVEGYKPYKREKEFLKSISLIMGNRGRLNWNLPVIDSFEFNKSVYNVSDDIFDDYLKEIIEIMGISNILSQPVRNLSLGQRMKCEIVLSLIHQPKILFLDEPTIGLDIPTQRKIREFIKEYNKRYNTTIMITSHNMNDIETLCNRVIIINNGEIIFDGNIKGLTELVSKEKIITITIKDNNISLENIGKIREQKDGSIEMLVNRDNVKDIISQLISNPSIYDIDITDIPIEEIIEKVFSGELL
jgi:ABC-2 type transport system ATP-binding protein